MKLRKRLLSTLLTTMLAVSPLTAPVYAADIGNIVIPFSELNYSFENKEYISIEYKSSSGKWTYESYSAPGLELFQNTLDGNNNKIAAAFITNAQRQIAYEESRVKPLSYKLVYAMPISSIPTKNYYIFLKADVNKNHSDTPTPKAISLSSRRIFISNSYTTGTGSPAPVTSYVKYIDYPSRSGASGDFALMPSDKSLYVGGSTLFVELNATIPNPALYGPRQYRELNEYLGNVTLMVGNGTLSNALVFQPSLSTVTFNFAPDLTSAGMAYANTEVMKSTISNIPGQLAQANTDMQNILNNKPTQIISVPRNNPVPLLTSLGLPTNITTNGVYTTDLGTRIQVVMYDPPTSIAQLNLS